MSSSPALLERPRLTHVGRGEIVVVRALTGSGKSVLVDQTCAGMGPVTRRIDTPGVQPLRVTVSGPSEVADALAGVSAVTGGGPAVGPEVDRAWALLSAEASRTLVCVDDLRPGSPELEEWAVGQIEDLASAGLRLVLAGTHLPTLPLRAWRLEGRLRELADADLAFTLDELATAVTGTADDPPPWLIDVHGRTGGWPGALAPIRRLRADRPEGPSPRAIDQLVSDLADHLTASVLAQIGPTRRRMLLLCALPPSISRVLAEEVGPPDAGRDLRDLVDHTPALSPVPSEPGWFRLHPLVAAGARRILDVGDDLPVRDLVLRIAAWHQREGDVVHAAEILIHGRRWDEALELLLATSPEFADANEQAVWLGLLDRIPRGMWDRDPGAILNAALLAMCGGRETEAVGLLSKPPLTAHDLPGGTAAVADVMRAWLVSCSSPPEVALAAAERALGALPTVDEVDLPEVLGIRARRPYEHMAEICAGRALTDLYRWPEARRRLEVVARDPGVTFLVRLNAQSALAYLHARRGEVTEAERMARAAQTSAERRGVPDSQALAEASLGRAGVALWRLDVERCAEALVDARRQATRQGASAQLAAIAAAEATIALLHGDPDRMLAILDAAPRRSAGATQVWSECLRARALSRSGRDDQARRIMRALPIGPDTVITMAEVLVPHDDVDVSRAGWRVPDWPSARLQAALAEGLAAHRRGEDSRPALLDALDIARPDLLVASFAGMPASMLAPVLDLPSPDAFERALLAMMGATEPAPIDGPGATGLDDADRVASTRAAQLVRTPAGALTPREAAVLRALAGPEGLAEVAASLYMSTNTLKTHTRRIYRKLGVSNRPEAVEHARRHGLV
jgi:LuxR family maltose regulon positive regulatory protein